MMVSSMSAKMRLIDIRVLTAIELSFFLKKTASHNPSK
jgi:hypothetical protein